MINSLLFLTLLPAGLIQAAEPYHRLEIELPRKVTAGNSFIRLEYKGTTWGFLDQASADKFKADPEESALAYNNHCTNTSSSSRDMVLKSRTRLEIYHDYLYLHFSGRSSDCWLNGVSKIIRADADSV